MRGDAPHGHRRPHRARSAPPSLGLPARGTATGPEVRAERTESDDGFGMTRNPGELRRGTLTAARLRAPSLPRRFHRFRALVSPRCCRCPPHTRASRRRTKDGAPTASPRARSGTPNPAPAPVPPDGAQAIGTRRPPRAPGGARNSADAHSPAASTTSRAPPSAPARRRAAAGPARPLTSSARPAPAAAPPAARPSERGVLGGQTCTKPRRSGSEPGKNLPLRKPEKNTVSAVSAGEPRHVRHVTTSSSKGRWKCICGGGGRERTHGWFAFRATGLPTKTASG